MKRYNVNLLIGTIALFAVSIIHVMIVVNFNQSHVMSTLVTSLGFYPALFLTLIAVRTSQKKEYLSRLQEEEE